MRRCPTFLAALAATLALLLASRPTTATADSITTVDYTLTSDKGIPAAPDPADPNNITPQVIATIVPPGGIVPPPATTDNPDGNPLTILPDSAGLNQQKLYDALSADKKFFGFLFVGSGLASASDGGKLHFSLSIDKALASDPPTFTLPSDDPYGVHILLDAPVVAPIVTQKDPDPPSTDTGTSQVTVTTPEPCSLVLWSALAGAGVWRLRRRRRMNDLRA